jgi:hypothetical protein
MFWLGAGMFFAGETAKALPEQVSCVIAPDRAEIADSGAGYSSIPSGITPEAKTEGLPRVRSTFFDARQVRKLIENFDGALDCETVETTVLHDGIAAPPRSQGSRRPDLNGLLLSMRLQHALETSA